MTEEMETPKPKKVRLESVKVLTATPQSALVEWEGRNGLQRGYVQADAVNDGRVDADLLAVAIPYGIAWEEIGVGTFSREVLAKELRAAGIWTKQDLMRSPQKAVDVLKAMYGVHLGVLLQFADKE